MLGALPQDDCCCLVVADRQNKHAGIRDQSKVRLQNALEPLVCGRLLYRFVRQISEHRFRGRPLSIQARYEGDSPVVLSDESTHNTCTAFARTPGAGLNTKDLTSSSSTSKDIGDFSASNTTLSQKTISLLVSRVHTVVPRHTDFNNNFKRRRSHCFHSQSCRSNSDASTTHMDRHCKATAL